MDFHQGIRFRVLRLLATGVYHLAWPIVFLSLLLAAGSIYLATKKLSFSGNPNDLLRSDASYHQRYLEYTREFRAEEDYAIVVSGAEFERNRQCVEWIAEKLKQRPDLFQKIFYKMDFSELADRGMLYLEIDQLQQIDQGIEEFTSLLGKDDLRIDLNSLLSTAAVKFDPKYMRKKQNQEGIDQFASNFINNLSALADRLEGKTSLKPVQFGDFIAKNAQLNELTQQQAQREYLPCEDGKILIIQVPSPKKEASFGDHDDIIVPLKNTIQEARLRYPDLEIGLTGEPALSEDQAQATQKDATLSAIVTLVLIALLFWFSYRELSRPALALITLLVAVCWTVGFTTLSVGRLNILSSAFIPMILGLGIDFGIQILGRYEEELSRTSDVITALTHTVMNTGNAIITGASTTAIAFYTMCWNKFAGLSEMGLIGGTGILLCVVGNLVLLPALLSLRDRRHTLLQSKTPQPVSNEKQHFFDRLILNHAWTIILIALGVTMVLSLSIRNIWFDYNLLNLQNRELESVKYERKLLDSGYRSIIFAAIVCNDLKEAEEKTKKTEKLQSVHSVMSLTKLVPQNQNEKLKITGRIKSRLEKVKLPKPGITVNVGENIRVLQLLKTNCEKMLSLSKKSFSKKQRAEAQEFFGKLIFTMDRALKVLRPMNQIEAEKILSAYQTQLFGELHKNLETLKRQKVDRSITENDVPQSLRERYLGKSGKILLEIYPKDNVWEREPLERFVRELRTVDQDVTGTPVQNFEYIELLKTSYEEAAVYALIAIFLLVVFHFRTIKFVLPTMLPLILGIVWTAGTMPLIHLPFNPANIITLPLVIGVGVAYGIYAVDRYRENRSPALFSTSTGKAILLSAFTTIFGFGSLAFASDPALISLGILMTIGVTMCLITSLYVCPAVLHVLGRRRIK